MGKLARGRKHADKMKAKRAKKAAKAAMYKNLAGTSKKAKRQGGKTGPTTYKHAHRMANCGNVGCAKCFPELNS